MENSRYVKVLYLFGIMGTFFMFPLFLFAYSEATAHPALTDQAVKFFNIYYPNEALTDKEKAFILQGSIDEDDGARFLQHFYDPVYDRGLVLVKAKEWQKSKEWAQDSLAQASIADKVFAGTLTSFFVGEDDYSWERGIYEYAWGDKSRGLLTLGHILHLLEDATVPDHTRNDPHPAILGLGSPYEYWTKQFNISNVNIASGLTDETPVLLSNLDNYFDELARYSNNNFFSKDTTFIKEYKKPYVVYYDKEFGFYNTKQQEDDYPIIRKIKEVDGSTKYTLIDDKRNILNAYWSRLSKQAVLYGAGAVKLFFDEVEKERQTKILYNKNKSWFVKLWDKLFTNDMGISPHTASVIGARNSFPLAPNENKLAPNTNEDTQDPALSVAPTLAETITQDSILDEISEDELGPSINEGIQDQTFPVAPTSVGAPPQGPTLDATEKPRKRTPYSPGFGGGGGQWNNNPEIDSANNLQNSDTQDTTESVPDENDENKSDDVPEDYNGADNIPEGDGNKNEEDNMPPNSPTITPSPSGRFVFNATPVSIEGEAEASSTVQALYLLGSSTTTIATTTIANGRWGLNIELDQGSTTINFSATDEAGNTSSSTQKIVFVDTQAPSIFLASDECDNSLSETMCLVSPRDPSGNATTTLNFSWYSTADDLAFYTVNNNGAWSTTTATSTAVTTPDNSRYIFGVSAEDNVGNRGATSTLEVEVVARPVVINEIAWMGTRAGSADEWIELFNTTSQPITFDDSWVLYSTSDKTPYITLEGEIPAKGYYLIERKNSRETDELTESSITDIPADLWTSFSFGLSNSGEDIVLTRASTTIDEVKQCNGRWCGGDGRSRFSMERYDPYKAGTDKANWGRNNIFIKNGLDNDGNTVFGTPKARNSINHHIINGSVLVSDKTLLKNNSPYLIPSSGLTVREGATLTIEPGVVIKFVVADEPMLDVNGTLIANGTEEEPVVFTAFTDDEYGGDLNADGMCDPQNASSTAVCPAPGWWKQILIHGPNSGSSLKNTIVRYGGRYFSNTSFRGAVAAYNTEITLENVTIEHAEKYGLYLENATSTIARSSFKNNDNENGSAGMYILRGESVISDSTFDANTAGAYIVSAPNARIESNIFTGNTKEAVRIFGTVGTFRNNSGTNNGMNALVIGNGAITTKGATTTLGLNQLPYFIKNDARVIASSTLAFEKGVVVKSHKRVNDRGGGIIVESGGTMFYDGSSPSDVVFTSVNDDTVGGAVDTATTSPKAGDWFGFEINGGGIIDMRGFTLRYAGDKRSRIAQYGAIKINGDFSNGSTQATSTIRNALLENNYQFGINLIDNATLVLEDTELRGHTEKNSRKATALRVYDATAILKNILFANNSLDISATGDSYNISADEATKSREPSTDPANLFE